MKQEVVAILPEWTSLYCFCFAFLVSFIILANETHAFVGGDGHHHSLADLQMVGWGQGPSQLARRFVASGLRRGRLGAPVNLSNNPLLRESPPKVVGYNLVGLLSTIT